ncbi:MAG: hypothetical protein KC731_15325 [Myxococcales bacterium]|nr:hypothetical protein [Myxococcales bacterium]
MPTNRDWLEHTEKAAWDTVGALREQVAEAQERADRLTRLEPTLPRLAELLDEACESLGIPTQAPAIVVEKLIAEVTRLREAQATQEQAPPPPRRSESPASRPEAVSPTARPSEPAASSAGLPRGMRWFAKQLTQRLHQRDDEDDFGPPGATLPEVAPWVEERLRSLTPLPYAPTAVRQAALALGVLAFELARAARRAERNR